MPPNRPYADYPGAREASADALEFKIEEDKNPVIRGLPLVLGSILTEWIPLLPSYLWKNAGFGRVRGISGLDGKPYRFKPTVIPLPRPDDALVGPGIEPHLFARQSPSTPGRFYSATDFYDLYQKGEVTPLQVAEALLPYIQRDYPLTPNPTNEYSKAWVHCNLDQVRAAAAASTQRWKEGRPLSVLDGVPIGVKDDLDVEGYVTSVGMPCVKGVPFFEKKCASTLWSVQQLVDAGAVIVGKNNMHEIGVDTTGCNPRTGTPVMWYNKNYYPGGSSSGGASSLSAGMVPIAIGSDAVLFAPSLPPEPSAPKRIGIYKEWLDRANDSVLTLVQNAIDYLVNKLGYEAVPIKLPYLREGQLVHGGVCLTEAAHSARLRVSNSVYPCTPSAPSQPDPLSFMCHANRILHRVGACTQAADYLGYAQMRQVVMQHLAFLFEQYPGLLIVTPTTPIAGWPIAPDDGRYGFTDTNTGLRNMMYCWLANMSGCPAVTCPVGYADPAPIVTAATASGGDEGQGKLPVGLMAMGEWGTEESLLTFAGLLETYLNDAYPGGRLRPRGWLDVIELAKKKSDGNAGAMDEEEGEGGSKKV